MESTEHLAPQSRRTQPAALKPRAQKHLQKSATPFQRPALKDRLSFHLTCKENAGETGRAGH